MNDTGIVSIHGRDYQTVAKRIKDFRAAFPDYRVLTDLIHADSQVVQMKASILNESGDVISTGYAEEVRGKGINATSALENAETSAVGRALAFLGFGGTSIASAEEMRSTALVEPPASHETEMELLHAFEQMDDISEAQRAFIQRTVDRIQAEELTEAEAQKILAKLRKAEK